MEDQKVRVAFLTTSFPLKIDSVSGIFVQRLVKSLPPDFPVTVITPCDTSPVKIEDNYKLVNFRYAPWRYQLLAHQPGGIPVALKGSMLMRLLLPIFLLAMFFACLRVSMKSDIIHANWSVNGAIAALVGLLLRKPVVTTLRGEDVTRSLHSNIYRWILRWCLKTNRKVITVSKAIHDHLVHEYPLYKNKIVFQPNGVSSDLLNLPIKNKRTGKQSFELLTIGSLIPRKGIDTIIEALSYLSSREGVNLSIVGNGPEIEKLESLVKEKSLGKVVTFVGEVSADHIAGYLHNADAFILASYSEGRPNVLLESFASGIPVIASDIDGVRELVQDGKRGLKFQPGNARELASKIEELQQSNELQIHFAHEGRLFITENQLLWEHVGQRYADLYKEILGCKV